MLFDALYELPKILLLRGGLPAGVVDLVVKYEGGGPAGVVDGACDSKEPLPLRLGVLGDLKGFGFDDPGLKLKDIGEASFRLVLYNQTK